jgi:hypothetical protein
VSIAHPKNNNDFGPKKIGQTRSVDAGISPSRQGLAAWWNLVPDVAIP